ncbi:MAG: hypothetical protein NUV80_07450 [Candidatus Berkelbacteria bacterium]|nr:hypothetical protein [Candidatus Berkelbacteria bacterium]
MPVWVKPLILVLAVAAIFGYGYHKGLLSGEADLNEYKLAVNTEQSIAANRTFERIIKQKDISSVSEQRINKRLNAVSLKYSKLLKCTTNGSCGVPPVSAAPAEPNATPTDGVSIERYNTLVGQYNQLAEDATKTTIIAEEWQHWANENLK